MALIFLFFSTGFTEQPPAACFTTLQELYCGSRIDLSIPGEGLVVSLPSDYANGPWPSIVEPIRNEGRTYEPYTFGDGSAGHNVSPNLSPILLEHPVLDGYVKLCNRYGDCDELNFTLEDGLILP